MSNTKKIEISNVGIKEALSEIKELSNNKVGIIYNKNAQEAVTKILTGDDIEIEKVANSKENNKIINTNSEPKNKKNKTIKSTPKLK